MNLLALIAVFLVALRAVGAGVQFPSEVSIKSLDGKWQVACKSSGESDEQSGHLLLLKRIGVASVELRRFDRHCDNIWSPDSSHLAVTDWLGSNMSDVFIYSVTNSATGISVGDLFPKGTISEAELRGHCYFEATKWLDHHRLRIRVFGHTDEVHAHSFKHTYVFDLRSGHFEEVGKRGRTRTLQATAATPRSRIVYL